MRRVFFRPWSQDTKESPRRVPGCKVKYLGDGELYLVHVQAVPGRGIRQFITEVQTVCPRDTERTSGGCGNSLGSAEVVAVARPTGPTTRPIQHSQGFLDSLRKCDSSGPACAESVGLWSAVFRCWSPSLLVDRALPSGHRSIPPDSPTSTVNSSCREGGTSGLVSQSSRQGLSDFRAGSGGSRGTERVSAVRAPGSYITVGTA